jgi:hypothetical protein
MNRPANTLAHSQGKGMIAFKCLGLDEGEAEASLFDEFLLEVSQGRSVFVEAYRLPTATVIAQEAIIAQTGVIADPFRTFFHLTEARVHCGSLTWASEFGVYCFDPQVGWERFLATVPIREPQRLLKNGLLSAYFLSYDQGSDFAFLGSQSTQEAAFRLFGSLSACGWRIEKTASIKEVWDFG